MALTRDEKDEQRQTLIAPIPHQSLVFGLGLGLGFLYLSRSQFLSAGIKLADGALKASKILPKFQLQSPTSPHSILTASKAIIKACKLSSRLKPTQSGPRITLPFSPKLIKASLGAANLIRYIGHGFMGLGFLNGGYKVSKNLVKVLEGCGALELDSVTRNGLKSLGLGVRTVIVLGEVELLVSIRQWRRSRCRFARHKGLRYGFCLNSKGLDFGNYLMRQMPLDHLVLCDRDDPCLENNYHVRIFELLSLSIPVTNS